MTSTTRTILIIDDEELLRRTACRLLTALGNTASSAANGEEALTLYETPGCHFDIVIIDINMPGITTQEIVTGLEEKDPDARLILTSGKHYHEELVDIIERHAFLPKPYGLNELQQALQ